MTAWLEGPTPKFNTTYKDAEGKTVEEARFAASRENLLAELRAAGLVPIAVRADEGAQAGVQRAATGGRGLRLGGRVKLNEVAVSFRTLATMLSGGLPIIDSLIDVADQSDNARFKQVMRATAADVQKGSTLSDAMAKHPNAFSPLACAMVQAGEESGNLTRVLGDLADYLEGQVELRRKIKAGTRYPLFILGVFFIAILIIFGWILPQFQEVFASFKAKLPPLTLTLMAISSGFADNILYVLAGVVALIVAFVMWVRTEGGRRAFDAFMLRVPVFGRLVHQIIIARLSRTLSLLIESGIPMVEALRLCGRVIGNTIITEELHEVQENIVRGSSLSQELGARPHFPRMLVRMTAAGEASGRLGDMLDRVAVHYNRESSSSIDGLLAMLEPALLIGLGVVVAIVVMGVYFPIFNLAKSM